MTEIVNQELIVVVMPGGSLQLEWADGQDTVGKSSRLLQDEIYRRFSDDAGSWLLFLKGKPRKPGSWLLAPGSFLF